MVTVQNVLLSSFAATAVVLHGCGDSSGPTGGGRTNRDPNDPNCPPRDPNFRPPSSEKVLQEIQNKFDSRLQFSQAKAADAGSFGDIHRVQVKCQDGAKDLIVKVVNNLEKLPHAESVKDCQEESARDAGNLAIVRGSPYFPQIYASVKGSDGFTTAIMESLHGDLDKFQSSIQSADEAQRYAWAMQFLQGIKVLHDKGFLHKDIKPGNVMLSGPADQQDSEVRLIDLGSMCNVKEGASDRCGLDGLHGVTTSFCPPEFFTPHGHPRHWNDSSAANMKKVDVWAAGIVLSIFFSRSDPFVGQPPAQFVKQVEDNIWHFQNLDQDLALSYFMIPYDSLVRKLFKSMFATSVDSRASIDDAIKLLTDVIDKKRIKVSMPVLTEERKGPKCLKSCHDDQCFEKCHVKIPAEVGRVAPVQDDQCVKPAGDFLPGVKENHFQEL